MSDLTHHSQGRLQRTKKLLSTFGLDLPNFNAVPGVDRHAKRSAHATPIKLAHAASPLIKAEAEHETYEEPEGTCLVGIERGLFDLPANADLRFKRLLETYHITVVDSTTETAAVKKPSIKSGAAATISGKAGASGNGEGPQPSGKDDEGTAAVSPQ